MLYSKDERARKYFPMFERSVFVFIPTIAHAQSVAELQSQIDANNRQLESLKTEIATFQKQLDEIGEKKSTLQSTISSLALSQKQLTIQIQITQNKIASANLQIKQLTLSIGDKEASIVSNQSAIAKALRKVAENEQTPLVTSIISAHTLGEAWKVTDEMVQFNRALSNDIKVCVPSVRCSPPIAMK